MSLSDIDIAALPEWNAAQLRAREAYYSEAGRTDGRGGPDAAYRKRLERADARAEQMRARRRRKKAA